MVAMVAMVGVLLALETLTFPFRSDAYLKNVRPR